MDHHNRSLIEITNAAVETMKDKLLGWLNTALMWNLFLVLAAFAWFAIAVVGRSMNVSLGLEFWYKLWQPLFQPAIGLLMLGAIASGVVSWVNKRLDQRASNS